MGCTPSKKAVDPSPGTPRALQAATAVVPGPRAEKPLAPLTPEAQAAAEARTVRLLESLAAKEERVKRPVLPNSKRRRSGQRGMTRALLFGVKAFFEKHNALDKTMQDIVNEHGFPFSACELTKWASSWARRTRSRPSGSGCSRG